MVEIVVYSSKLTLWCHRRVNFPILDCRGKLVTSVAGETPLAGHLAIIGAAGGTRTGACCDAALHVYGGVQLDAGGKERERQAGEGRRGQRRGRRCLVRLSWRPAGRQEVGDGDCGFPLSANYLEPRTSPRATNLHTRYAPCSIATLHRCAPVRNHHHSQRGLL